MSCYLSQKGNVMLRRTLINLTFFVFIVAPTFLHALPMPYFGMQSARRLLRSAISQSMVQSYKRNPEQFCVQPGKQTNGSPEAYVIQTKERFTKNASHADSLNADRIHDAVVKNRKSLHELARIARAAKAVETQKKGQNHNFEKPYFDRQGHLSMHVSAAAFLNLFQEGGFRFPVP